MGQGTFGRIVVMEDFLGLGQHDGAWTVTGIEAVGQLAMTSVNEGSLAHTVDEPGGIIAITTDIGDNDNAALYAGPFKPSDGGVVMEARLKINDITLQAVYVGFTETLSATTPVMPAEFAVATMTYNGTGGMAGLQFDSDGTIDDWRAIAADGGAVSANADPHGTRSYNPPVNDKFDVIRVEIGENGKASVYLAEDIGSFKLIKEIEDAVNPDDVQHAVVMVENRSAAAKIMEVDYFYARGNRNWAQ